MYTNRFYICIPGGASTIAYGVCEAVAADDRDGVRRHASRRKLRWLTRRKIASRYRTLTADGSQGTPEAIHGLGFDDGGPCAVSDWIGSGGHGELRMTALEGRQNIYICRTIMCSPRVSYFRFVAVKNW